MNDFTMVIPSYWGRTEREEKSGPGTETVVFDHPTALESQGTLGRLLKSLDVFGSVPGRIVIIAVANRPEITGEVEARVEEIIAPWRRHYNICCLGQSSLEKIRARLADRGVSPAALDLVNLDSYAAVRNICSLAGILNGSRYTIFIDDDEVFADSGFLDKIERNMGRPLEGDTVAALAGYYLQPETYLLDESSVPGWRASCWNNAAAMNQAFERFIGRGEPLKPVPFVFGGNMTVDLQTLSKVPFDPRITRGEDIDFLLNLRINGIIFYLDRDLAIKHLPPASDQPAWKKLREDALRFLYERQKVRDHPELSLEDLQPYPGLFLGDDLEERIIETCGLLKAEYEAQRNPEGASRCLEIIGLVEDNPFAGFDTKSWLAEITARWREVTGAAAGMGIPA